MSEASSQPHGPDLSQGVAVNTLADGEMVVGHVGDEPVLLVRRSGDLLAVAAVCTHYGGPLAEGLLVGDTVRCPWHHACFSLRTGAAVRPPALNGLQRWRVEQREGMAFVREELPAPKPPVLSAAGLARFGRHRGWRRRGQCSRRDLAAGRLCRPHRAVERGCVAAVRSAQPVEGLPRRGVRSRTGSRCDHRNSIRTTASI